MTFFAAKSFLGAHGGQALITLFAGRVLVLDSGLESEDFQFFHIESEGVVMGRGTHTTRDPDVVARLELSNNIAELLCGFIGGAVELAACIVDLKDEVSTRDDVGRVTHLALDNQGMIG